MKYKITKNEKTEKVIEVHIPKEMVGEALRKIYSDISKTASIPGFRAGKAPPEIIKQKFKKEAHEEVMRNLVADSFTKAVKESDIKALGSPEISDLEFEEDKGLSYKAKITVRPEVNIKLYKGLELKKTDTEVKESDVDAYVANIREMGAKFETKEGKAVKGDYLICDMDCYVEEKFVEKKENAWLYASDDSYIPGKELEGLGVNDEKGIEKDLPKEYSKSALAGKRAKFHIKVKELKTKTLPEVNDEFAKSMGKFQNMAEMKEAVRENLRQHKKVEERRSLEHQALAILDKSAAFDVSQSIVERHLDRLTEERKARLKREKHTDDDIKSKEPEIRKRLKDEAAKQVRYYFILDEIAKRENVRVSEDELEAAFGEIAQSSNHSAEEVKKYYNENDLVDDLAVEIRQKKVFDFIIANAVIS
ncbi:MAG: trigger factor [Candidatus Omnitrophica bacterium]|nr:trigger factor [Candidatus Omnitrophota bacterium]